MTIISTDLQIQYNPYQNPNDIFCRNREPILNSYKISKVPKSQNNLEKEEKNWMAHNEQCGTYSAIKK